MIRTTAFLILVVIATSVGQAQPFGKLVKKTPGIVSYTLRDSFGKDVPGTLDKIKAWGITDIEFSSLFGKTATELRALLDQRGLHASSYGVSYDAIDQKPDSILNNAKILGVKYIRIGSIPHKSAATLEMMKQAADVFNRFGKQAHDKGFMFCYHNHGFEFQPYEGGTLFDYLVKQTNPDYVGYEMDVTWTYLPGQDPAALLTKYPKRFRLIHLKDVAKDVEHSDKGGMPNEKSVVLGTGQIDWPAVLRAANKASIDHFYIEDESKAAEEQVPKSMAYLKSL
ncbi:sugar phosphate isomerase/epimerase family protein [Spirosoma endophyticum]|uniref:Sugar phosphate isomerase/epimerase n=1 Tax=Spirosoma endophyticum TaxID=662367 RepID=A0A1I1IAK8_9BACT|nr:sugar phosphate isomerase/epimerase [Spirosoma endophyticum]SFC33204.1 Sugar phosphate isomerase/epimerase [Spirosoma endophyticum]